MEYCELEVKVVESFRISKGIHVLVFFWPNHPIILPGQFISLQPGYWGSVMPRPFSVYKTGKNYVSILFQIVGENTKYYSELDPGDRIKIFGPRGNRIVIDEKYDRIILVSGGIGIAPLTFLANTLIDQGREVLFLAGFRENVFGISTLENYRCNVRVITEKGQWKNGLVTELLAPELDSDQGRSLVVSCGPIPMQIAVNKLAAGRNRTKILWEEIMACSRCGCKGCAVPVKGDSYAHTCKDGPAFDSEDIDWNRVKIKKPFYFKVSEKEKPKIVTNPLAVVLTGQNGQRLELEYPTCNASGCMDTDEIEKGWVDISRLGMLASKGSTLESKQGNPPPRVWEVFGGMLNSIGLQNDGLEIYLKRKLPIWLSFGKPIAANIAGRIPEEYGQIAARLADSGVSMIVLNVSCPNMNKRIIGKYPELIKPVVAAARKAAPNIFLYVKLPPMASDIVACGQAAMNEGADGLTLINTLEGMDIDIDTLEPVLGGVYGGLSGKAIIPVGLKIVDVCYRAGLRPIAGAGGIFDSVSAIKYFAAGASIIQIGTALFANPGSGTDICPELLKYMEKKNIPSIMDLTGLRHRINQ